MKREPHTDYFARFQVWEWMKACVEEGKDVYSCNLSGVRLCDVAGLFRRLKETAGHASIFTHANAVDNYSKLQLNGTNIFAFLDFAETRLKAQNDEMPKDIQVHFSDAFKKMKILHALRHLPDFRRLLERWAQTMKRPMLPSR